MKKRIFKLILALVIILGAALGLVSCGGTSTLPDAESASGSIANTSISWSYDADTKILTLTGTGDIPDTDSPNDIWWYSVRHSVKRIEIPEGITAIGSHAFYYCPQLETVNMPESVSRFGKLAFAFCSSLKSIEIPDGVVSIGEGCFEACAALETIYIPVSVNTMGARVFAHCSSLREAIVMAQIDELADWSFKGCTALDSVVFSEAVRDTVNVSANAFESAKKDFSGADFTASVTGEVTLTVKYVYEDGSEAAPDALFTYKRGESYSIVSPTLEGYTASKLTVTGDATSDLVETVTYNAVSTETEAVTEAETESVQTQEDKDGIGVGGIVAIIIFAVVIAAIVVLAVIMLRSDKKQNGGKGAPKRK